MHIINQEIEFFNTKIKIFFNRKKLHEKKLKKKKETVALTIEETITLTGEIQIAVKALEVKVLWWSLNISIV